MVGSGLLRRQYQEGPFWSLVKLAIGLVLMGALPPNTRDLSHYDQRQVASTRLAASQKSRDSPIPRFRGIRFEQHG
jgi:hypothetical protein